MLQLRPPVERHLAGGEAHLYTITMEAGQHLQAIVDQRGIDVVVSVFAPGGSKLADIDSPNGDYGPEPVNVTASVGGTYRQEVRALEKDAAPGRYEVKIEAVLSLSSTRRSSPPNGLGQKLREPGWRRTRSASLPLKRDTDSRICSR